VALCGHGTLAAAGALFAPETGNLSRALTFHTLSGPLTATRLEDTFSGSGGNCGGEGSADVDPASKPLPSVELDFPMNVPTVRI